MPGFALWENPGAADFGPDVTGLLNLQNSTTCYGGDPVVMTTVTASTARVRPLSAGDIAALYQASAVNVGILGISPSTWKTDASGIANQLVPPPVSVSTLTQPIYAIPSIQYWVPAAPTDGRSRINVFTAANQIAGSLWQNTTITSSLVDTRVGILISTINSVLFYFWSTAATTKIGSIVAVSETNPLFGKTVTANVQDTTHYPRCPVVVAVDQTYQENLNNLAYAS